MAESASHHQIQFKLKFRKYLTSPTNQCPPCVLLCVGCRTDHEMAIILWQNQINYLLIESQNHRPRHKYQIQAMKVQTEHFEMVNSDGRGGFYLRIELLVNLDWEETAASHPAPGGGQLQTTPQLFKHPTQSLINQASFEVSCDQMS